MLIFYFIFFNLELMLYIFSFICSSNYTNFNYQMTFQALTNIQFIFQKIAQMIYMINQSFNNFPKTTLAKDSANIETWCSLRSNFFSSTTALRDDSRIILLYFFKERFQSSKALTASSYLSYFQYKLPLTPMFIFAHSCQV